MVTGVICPETRVISLSFLTPELLLISRPHSSALTEVLPDMQRTQGKHKNQLSPIPS